LGAFVPLKFALGEAFQFDWSEEHLVIGGVWRKLLVAHLKLATARHLCWWRTRRKATKCCLMPTRGALRPWAAFRGGDLRQHEDGGRQGQERQGPGRQYALCGDGSHYLFDPDFCNVASGWEKGVVEKNVQDSRRRIWQDAGDSVSASFAELNLWLLARCRALWQEAPPPRVRSAPCRDARTGAAAPDADGTRSTAMWKTLGKVSSTCLVTFDRNRYSAPCELVGQMVSIRLYPERIDLVAHDAWWPATCAVSAGPKPATTGNTTFR
jgi:hypothetical protein